MGQATDVMLRKIAAFNAHDRDGIHAVFGPGCRAQVPGAALDGPGEVAAFFAVFWEAVPDLEATVERSVEEGSVVFTQGRCTGRHTGTLRTPAGDIPPTGRPVQFPWADVYDVRDGRIVQSHLYFDRLALLEQLGAVAAGAPAAQAAV